MSRALFALVCAAALLVCPSSGARPPPAISAFAARYGDAVVRVRDPSGGASGSGFFVATVGYAVASLPDARVGAAVVVELFSGERRRGQVIAREAEGPLVLVFVQAAREGEVFPSLRLGPPRVPGPKAWLVGLCSEAGRPAAPVLGGLRARDRRGRWLLDLPCDAGAPILDEAGQVIAVVLAPRGARGSVAIGVERVQKLAARLTGG